ncbi:type III-A CRISPR-associated protein Cas10/Csm1 [Methylomonas rapida]|uniref:CRISPR system single-strand-specific deoxyribonuclease Cas10/Csm1 (subtype III-A) n=1 Tax=Methylomonas rapida TaxID=2963939 RepID=A0ABY7GF79_9GAMM|nr:type III-A CRISPR-associated protein Cas10/Csm1 [Methylomonas rapida]WAR43652.1 type III-A CRISPR-associated protein Cas10/Csm1 [Methylomonas rapida]
MKKHDHAVLGCLLHDIGKFFERAELLEHYRNDIVKRQSFCPKNREKGYYSHLHVLHTLAFCELLAEKIPQLKPVEQQTIATADQNWVNLATYHHVPSGRAEAYLEKLVQSADHLASAEREKGEFYEQGIHKKTRLESLLGRIQIGETARQNDYFLPLAGIQLSSASIYPQAAVSAGMEEKTNDKGKVWLSKTSLLPEYQKIAQGLLNDLEHLQSFQANVDKDKILKSVTRSLLTLLEKYLSQVPAATNVQHPDISLFDHLRVTAAIGESLFLHHQAKNETSGFDDHQTPKWQLVCGDFSGIQKFIYKITSKGAAKGLRGRSFFIQLLCDAVAEQIIRTLGLYPTARIYSSGGKFYLLIPTHLKAKAQSIADSVNKTLLNEFQGEVFLGLGFADICGDDFTEGNMGQRWQQVNEDLQKQRLQPFKAQVSQDIECFAQQMQHERGACKICGRDDDQADINANQNCRQCQSLERMGQALADTRYLFWVWGENRKTVKHKMQDPLFSLPIVGTDCEVYFLAQEPQFSELTDLTESHLEVLNDWKGLTANAQGYSQGVRYVGQWQNAKTSGDYEFDDFAEHAQGISRMGILRMDVDNLGEIFIRGLNFGKKDATGNQTSMGSLSRVATVSRQLHLFFAGYLHHILEAFPRSQIIYAGGDDVFIIGSWDELPDVAKKIRDEFIKYCANNLCFTLSGGIALVGGRYPISRAAELAGEAEEQAKHLQRGQKEKDALSFLETAIGWESFADAIQLRDTLLDIVEKTNSQAIIDRLRQVVIAVDEIKAREKSGNITDQIYWDKWRWRLVYNLKRMEKRYPEVAIQLENLQRQLITQLMLANKQPVMEWLQLPVRWAEFLLRSKTND